VDWAKPGYTKELGCGKKRKEGGENYWLRLKEESRVGLEREKERDKGWF
jgi:hypothetical protein